MSNEKKISKTEQQLNFIELEVGNLALLCVLHTFGKEKVTENLKELIYKEVLNTDDMILKEIFHSILKSKTLRIGRNYYSMPTSNQLTGMEYLAHDPFGVGQPPQSPYGSVQPSQDLSNGDGPSYGIPEPLISNPPSSYSYNQCEPVDTLSSLTNSPVYAHILRYIHNIVTEASTKLKKV